MAVVPARDLRNHPADVRRQVAEGIPVTVTVRGDPVAEITAVRSPRRSFLTREDVVDLIVRRQADPGLRSDLDRLAGDTTDDLDPL